jgi:hypothetical protein
MPARSRKTRSAEESGRTELADDGLRTPYARAQDGLSELIDATVAAQRVEAMNAAMRVDLIFLTVTYALRSEEAFLSPTVAPERRREVARRSVTAELATALHLPERTMERQISEAWALSTTLPATLTALRNGDLSARHASVIVDETDDLDDRPELREQLDTRLAELAATMTAAHLRRRARALREQLGAETLAERHRAAREQRRVEIEPARDGMAWLAALLPATDALLIRSRLDGVARAAGAEDHRLADQLRADAARDLLLHGSLPTGSALAAAVLSVRPTVHVTVPVLSLLGKTEDPGLLDGYGPIDADAARVLVASAASFTRLLTHPVSGAVLDVDRTTYRPPADLKRWLEVRDGTCRFPGCARRAGRCEVDHTVDWQHDGRTAFDNMAHLCAPHHHLKHETSWSVRHLADGVLEWTSPAGRRQVTLPARRIPGKVDSLGPPNRGSGQRAGSLEMAGAPPPA